MTSKTGQSNLKRKIWYGSVVHLFYIYISENKYGKYYLIDQYNLISPSNPMLNINCIYVNNICLDSF